MGSTRVAPTAHVADASIVLGRIALWAMLGAKLLSGLGIRWDIQWHVRVGRDSFWIPPHVMIYAGVTLVVLLSFGVLLRETLRHGSAPLPPPMVRRLGVVGTPGFHLAAAGIALTVLAAPIDDLWHRLFGLDVTLWSPPHLLGILGGIVNTLGCVMIADVGSSHWRPHVIVPRQRRETGSPVRPRRTRRMDAERSGRRWNRQHRLPDCVAPSRSGIGAGCRDCRARLENVL